MNFAIAILNKFNARKFELGPPYATSNKSTTINQSKETDKYAQNNKTKNLLNSYIKLESSDNSLLPHKDKN